ncbi:hypothetical protein OKW21_001599 [Catalinimonas alkaloidigena]|uniref:DUF4919 domain-containing protein n=1 Tax=Catalinimonas alkaloidigena TaxID=1075417 RepID=UPI0024066846|nr:DUF4919 domain-containing protein [Catalinimonas alkaloidigena]MDF9796336.1 hypothetical protein [Catalinimonas alkaloidigena]
MNRLLTLLFSIFSLSAIGQNFDYNKHFAPLLEVTKDSTSEYFYQSLLEKFEKADTSMTDVEVLIMMIGYTSQPNYKPYSKLDLERNILQLVADKKYNIALDSCNMLLQTNPLNFTALTEKGYCTWKLNLETAELDRTKVLKIISAIKYSGKGTVEDPYFVLGPSDGQVLIKYFWGGKIGQMGSGECEGANFCDILECISDDGTSTSLYFNIEHASQTMFDK